MITICPCCESQWTIDEIDQQYCGCCGYPDFNDDYDDWDDEDDYDYNDDDLNDDDDLNSETPDFVDIYDDVYNNPKDDLPF